MSQNTSPDRRAVAYIRESTEEQGKGYSPDGQRQAISRYATEHGLQLVEEYLDFETGRLAAKRPGFQRLIEDAMERRFEVVLVFHTSRFARNTVEAKRYKKLLRSELGIDVISVTQPLGTDAGDPAAFLSESVHEIFDDYYSVSLSFWTKMGLREKARQGLLTGSLPWGYVKGPNGIAMQDPEKAPFVLGMFERYATGQHTDRAIAEWLNVNEQRTPRDRAFGVDTVRDMLGNTAYCGYVSAHRDRSKTIKGLHEAIVPEELFDRVQALRRQRARTLKPGRPSERYLLRGLARCRRCHARMQGTAIGTKLVPSYYCATRRSTHGCDQPLVPAEEVERQLVAFIAGFTPNATIQQEILRRLSTDTGADSSQAAKRSGALEERLRRMRDLYELGDLTRAEYTTRRTDINQELASLTPGPLPDLEQARKVLQDFTIFWQTETEPKAKRQFLSQLFDSVWLDERRVAAVVPKAPFLPFFEHHAHDSSMCKERERRGSPPRLSPRR